MQKWSFIKFSQRKQIVYSFKATGMHSDRCGLIYLIELSVGKALHYQALVSLFFFLPWCPAELIMLNDPVEFFFFFVRTDRLTVKFFNHFILI